MYIRCSQTAAVLNKYGVAIQSFFYVFSRFRAVRTMWISNIPYCGATLIGFVYGGGWVHLYVSQFTVKTYCFADGRCLFKQPQSVIYHWSQYDEEISKKCRSVRL